jgi:hypothetical protein
MESRKDETVLDLQQQLHEKEMKLTDIRLEALSSAAQLQQLQDAMNRMQVRTSIPIFHTHPSPQP